MASRKLVFALRILVALVVLLVPSISFGQYARYWAMKGDGTALSVVSKNDAMGYLIDGGRSGEAGIGGVQAEGGMSVLEWMYSKGARTLVVACSHSHADHTAAVREMVRTDPWMAAFERVIFVDSGFHREGEATETPLGVLYSQSVRDELRATAVQLKIPVAAAQQVPPARSGTNTDLYAGLSSATSDAWVSNIPFEPEQPFTKHGHAIVHLIRLQKLDPQTGAVAASVALLEPDDSDKTALGKVVEIIERQGIHPDVLSVPHHGSSNPDPADLLRAAASRKGGHENHPILVFAANYNNRYMHPDPQTLVTCLNEVQAENIHITGSEFPIDISPDSLPQPLTPEQVRSMYLLHVHPYAVAAAEELADAQEAKTKASQRVFAPRNKGGKLGQPAARGSDILAMSAYRKASDRVSRAESDLAVYQEVAGLMVGSQKRRMPDDAITPGGIGGTASTDWPPGPDDARWGSSGPTTPEPWRPSSGPGATDGKPIWGEKQAFQEIVNKLDRAVEQEQRPQPVNPIPPSPKEDAKRRMRFERSKTGEPIQGGIILGGFVEQADVEPTGALVRVEKGMASVAVRGRKKDGKIIVVSYQPMSVTELWCAMQLCAPDDALAKNVKPEEVSLTSDSIRSEDAVGAFALHPAIEANVVGFNAMCLDHALFALCFRAKQPNCPEVLKTLRDFTFFEDHTWHYQWYDVAEKATVTGDRLSIVRNDGAAADEPVLEVRFWASGKDYPRPEWALPVVRKVCSSFDAMDRFARLTALCRWLKDHDISIKGGGTLVPERMNLHLQLLPFEVAPELWRAEAAVAK